MPGSERVARAEPLTWQKSSFSGEPHQNCLELAASPDGAVHLRESDDPATVLTTTRPRLAALLSRAPAMAPRGGAPAGTPPA